MRVGSTPAKLAPAYPAAVSLPDTRPALGNDVGSRKLLVRKASNVRIILRRRIRQCRETRAIRFGKHDRGSFKFIRFKADQNRSPANMVASRAARRLHSNRAPVISYGCKIPSASVDRVPCAGCDNWPVFHCGRLDRARGHECKRRISEKS
jgi:hypothetical protein